MPVTTPSLPMSPLHTLFPRLMPTHPPVLSFYLNIYPAGRLGPSFPTSLPLHILEPKLLTLSFLTPPSFPLAVDNVRPVIVLHWDEIDARQLDQKLWQTCILVALRVWSYSWYSCSSGLVYVPLMMLGCPLGIHITLVHDPPPKEPSVRPRTP